jgi:hypothetical protein
MGLFDKVLANGPFFETDDPKLWWRKYHNYEYVKDYWYSFGCRDNAFRLNRTGYPMLAAEHEAKYGPGMYKQIDALFEVLDAGVNDKSQEEKQEYLNKLQFFRGELEGSKDLYKFELAELIEKIDNAIMALMTKENVESVTEDNFADTGAEGDEEYEMVSEDDDDGEADVEYEYEYEDEEYDEEIDVEDELGLADDQFQDVEQEELQ